MAHNFHRPNLPYQGDSLPNDNRFQVLTRSLNAPPTDIMLDSELNSITDALNTLDSDIEGVVAGSIPGSDNPDNANMVVTVDGNGNLPLKLISDENCEVQSISGDKLIPGSIPSDRLINNSVSGTKIIDNAITENKIDDGAVTTDKVDDLAITNGKLSAGAVNTAKLADLSVSTGKLIDLSVTNAKLGNASVSTTKLIDLSVTTIKLADLSVSTGKLIDLCVTTPKLADLCVTAAKIANNTITFTQISNSFVATKAQQQAANSSSVFVSPATQQYHPSATHFWCKFDGSLTGTNAPIAGYNVASVTRIGAGVYQINFINPFNSNDYGIFPSIIDNGIPLCGSVNNTGQTASSCQVTCRYSTGALTDSSRVFVNGNGVLQ